MSTTPSLTPTLTQLHSRSTMGPNKSRMTNETMRLFFPILHGLTVTLKKENVQGYDPVCQAASEHCTMKMF
jgi:hypothetical protein